MTAESSAQKSVAIILILITLNLPRDYIDQINMYRVDFYIQLNICMFLK